MKKLILIGLLVLILPGLCLAQVTGVPSKSVTFKNLLICRSPKVVIGLTQLMTCTGGTSEFEGSIKDLMDNGFFLFQVVKAEKIYVYYFEKVKSD